MKTSRPPQNRYSYADYLTWPDDQRWELIDGNAYAMVPSPTTRHQSIQQNLSRLLGNHFLGKGCRPFHAPLDVKLSDNDVVQPDLLVVCDSQKIGDKAIFGAPDLVIEITSPATEARDRREKKALYERFGVAEYWIVSPNGFVEQLVLGADNRYSANAVFNIGEQVKSARFPDLVLSIDDIFDGLGLEVKETLPPPYASASG
ncbi:MAG: Uma2 family endonuclease [Gammaproteobacteria bacterium]